LSKAKTIRIGGGGGFYGDRVSAPINLLKTSQIDYLILDYLAELTMSILAKQRAREREGGWAVDLADWLGSGGITLLRDRSVRLVTNAGGANPRACAEHVLALAIEDGWSDCKVAVVIGDDLVGRVGELLEAGEYLRHLETDEPITAIRRRLASANAYLGAGGISRALDRGADIVITGRVADASLVVGPMIYESGWASRAEISGSPLCGPVTEWADVAGDDALNLLASWTVAGHLIECGAQSSGGNHTGWIDQPDLGRLGYPIAEIGVDGSLQLTKPKGSGGRLSRLTVCEQLVYEIADPKAYLTPDVIVDLSNVQIEDSGVNRVKVSGAKGSQMPSKLKVSASHQDGWFASAQLLIPGPNAVMRAQVTDETLRSRLDEEGLDSLNICTEIYGGGATVLPGIPIDECEPPEVIIRWAVSSQSRRQVIDFGREIAPLVLTGPAGVAGYSARPRPRSQFRYWPSLIERGHVESKVRVELLDSKIENLPRPLLNSMRMWLGQAQSTLEHELTDRLERMHRRAPEGRRKRVSGAILERLKGDT